MTSGIQVDNYSPQTPEFKNGESVGELVLVDIPAGPLYQFGYPHRGGSGGGRWILVDEDFTTWDHGRGYFDARSRPLIYMGHPKARDTMLWSKGTTHIIQGQHTVRDHLFHGDPAYPLAFKLVEGKGYVYLCGRGTVTTPQGRTYRLGFSDDVAMWLARSHSQDPLTLEAVAQALGYLVRTEDEAAAALPILLDILDGEEFSPAWTAAEALGRIGDQRAIPALERLIEEQEGSAWSRLAAESLQLIRGKTTVHHYVSGDSASKDSVVALFIYGADGTGTGQTLGDYMSFEFTRTKMVELLGGRASEFVEPLASALSDTSSSVRQAAAYSLAILGEANALPKLEQALLREEDKEVRSSIESAIRDLGQE